MIHFNGGYFKLFNTIYPFKDYFFKPKKIQLNNNITNGVQLEKYIDHKRQLKITQLKTVYSWYVKWNDFCHNKDT